MHLIVHEKSKSHTDLGNNIRVFSDDRRCRSLPVGLLPGSAGVRRLAVVLKFSRIVRTSITGHLYAGFLNHAVNKTIKFTYHTVLQTQQNVWGEKYQEQDIQIHFSMSLWSHGSLVAEVPALATPPPLVVSEVGAVAAVRHPLVRWMFYQLLKMAKKWNSNERKPKIQPLGNSPHFVFLKIVSNIFFRSFFYKKTWNLWI